MKLPAYLSPSRHGVWYFRWPLPVADGRRRSSLKISLRTKCPNRAGDLARHLASCGRLVRDNKTLARLRQDQMREVVRSYFTSSLALRGGSGDLDRYRAFLKWFSASVMPPSFPALAG